MWIAKSIGDGVCVLLARQQPIHGVYGVGSSCSASGEPMDDGATVEASDFPGEAGRIYVAGVVPDSVSFMQVTLADATTKTVAVRDNAWALETSSRPKSYRAISAGG